MHKQDWDFIAYDLDGTLTGMPGGGNVVYKNEITSHNSDCIQDEKFLNGIACANKTWIRMAYSFNTYSLYYPYSFYFYWTKITDSKNYSAYSAYSSSAQSYFALEVNQEYSLVHYSKFSGIDEISYYGTIFGLKLNEFVIIKHPVFGNKPSYVSIFSSMSSSESINPLNSSLNQNGDWYWDNQTNTLSYIVKNQFYSPFWDYDINFRASCSTPCVIKPTPPTTTSTTSNYTGVLNVTDTTTTRLNKYNTFQPLTEPYYSRPQNVFYWSNLSTWLEIAQPGWGGYTNGLPKDGDNVIIPSKAYVVVDCVLPKLKRLQIDGALEFENGRDHYLEVEIIMINGGQLIIGWENDPILSKVEIIFTGDSNSFQSADYSLMRTKGIGVIYLCFIAVF